MYRLWERVRIVHFLDSYAVLQVIVLCQVV